MDIVPPKKRGKPLIAICGILYSLVIIYNPLISIPLISQYSFVGFHFLGLPQPTQNGRYLPGSGLTWPFLCWLNMSLWFTSSKKNRCSGLSNKFPSLSPGIEWCWLVIFQWSSHFPPFVQCWKADSARRTWKEKRRSEPTTQSSCWSRAERKTPVLWETLP